MSTITPSTTLTELVDHVTTTHHAYLRAELPRLAALTAQAASQPGPHQGALQESAALLERFAREMLAHMDYEERVVFPLVVAIERGGPGAELAYRQLAGQRSELEAVHGGTGAELDELHRICDAVPAPTEAEPLLAELLDAYGRVITDTFSHVTVENDVMVPRALLLGQAAFD